ncbi:MAG TPA: tetratricopeptide repeat protein [Candidatus Didemnitutus sp.]|jgi:predicted O-linked N-acetylglucosamine transferase (SPINDLY family)
MNQRKIQQAIESALALHQRGELDEAARLYAEVRHNAPNRFDAWHLAGALEFQRGRLPEAVELLNRARRLDSQSVPCKLFLGMALADLGRFAEAEKPLQSALEKMPGHAEAWLNLARAHRALGRPAADIVAALRRAAALEPDRAGTQEQLGEALAAGDGLVAAEPHFRRATELDPGLACAWTNLGLALIEKPGRLDEAFACLERAITADPMSVEARASRALALLHAYRQEDAAAEYETAVLLEANNPRLLSARAMLSNYLPGRDAEAVFAFHTEFGRRFPAPPTAIVSDRDSERRLRVGFISPDLRTHPVATFLEPLLRHLDRQAFEVVLFHNDRRKDAVSERLRGYAAAWHDLNSLDDDAAETLVRRTAPDILVDLAGHSSGNHLSLFARRLAPVQVTYLGYPNTTGLAAMDFRFSDELADPTGAADALATERIVRFAPTAWAFQPPEDAPAVTARPEGASVVFGSFNNFTKVTDDMLQVWSRILSSVPDSRLMLKSRYFDEPSVIAAVSARLRTAGVAGDRFSLLAPRSSLREHLDAYAGVDVALDTFPYHGTTTTCEALWMGVPVVTLAGDRHAARVGCSLLTAVGHPEWIARDSDAYVRIALELAADRAILARHRGRLRDELRRSPLLDHSGQANRFGDALRKCWESRCVPAAPVATIAGEAISVLA